MKLNCFLPGKSVEWDKCGPGVDRGDYGRAGEE